MPSRQLNTTSVYRRLSQVGLSVGLLIVVLNMWVDTSQKGEQMQSANASLHTRLMFKQTALVAQRQIKAKRKTALEQTLNDMTKDPFIVQAIVYDRDGLPIAKSDEAQSAHQLYQKQRSVIDTLPPHGPEAVESPHLGLKMYVTEIREEAKIIGYLHVTYMQNQALAAPLQFHQGNMQKILLMMLLSGLIGYMLTRGFSRFSRQSYRITENDS